MAKQTKNAKEKDFQLSTDKLAKAVIEGMLEKKASEIISLDLRSIENGVADIFIVCHAESHVQVEAIAKSIEEIVFKELGIDPDHKEGKENAEWILLDYFDVIAHVFIKEKRDYYNLESLWGDADFKKIAQSKTN